MISERSVAWLWTYEIEALLGKFALRRGRVAYETDGALLDK